MYRKKLIINYAREATTMGENGGMGPWPMTDSQGAMIYRTWAMSDGGWALIANGQLYLSYPLALPPIPPYLRQNRPTRQRPASRRAGPTSAPTL